MTVPPPPPHWSRPPHGAPDPRRGIPPQVPPHRRPDSRRPRKDPRRVPSWGADLGRFALSALGAAVIGTIFVWVSGLGIFSTNGTRENIMDDSFLGGVVILGMVPAIWPIMHMSRERADHGFRRRGLLPLLLVAGLLLALLYALSTMVWGFFYGTDAPPGSIAEASTAPTSVLACLFLTLAIVWTASATVLQLVVDGGAGMKLLVVAVWLGLLGGGSFASWSMLGAREPLPWIVASGIASVIAAGLLALSVARAQSKR